MIKNSLIMVSYFTLMGALGVAGVIAIASSTGITISTLNLGLPVILAIISIVMFFTLKTKHLSFRKVISDIKSYSSEMSKNLFRAYLSFVLLGIVLVVLATIFVNSLLLLLGTMFIFWPITFGLLLTYAFRSDTKLFAELN